MDHQIHRRLDWLLPSWLEDADAYDQSINEDMTTVYYTIAVNVIVLAGCVLFFSFYRMYDDKIFSPKSALMPDRTPPRIPNDTAFGWIYHLWSIDDNILIDKGGYDVLFFIRFYRLSFKIFVSFTVYAWAVLLPINGTGSAGTAENSFEVWSMTNIPQGSPRCWFHLIGMYMLTGITIFFLEKEFVVYAKHRHVFLRQRHAHLRTVLVEGIPHKMRSTRTLATYFETLYPGAVLSVRLGQDLRYLDSLILEREDVAAMLERALFLNHLKNKRPTMYIPNMLERVDSIKYYTQVLEDLNEAVLSAQATALALTQYDEKDMTEGRALGLIEGFLHVTEIGSLKRLLKGRGKDKWALRGTRSSGGGLGKGDQDQPGSNSAKGGDVIQKPHSSLKTDGAISSLSRLLASSDDDSGGVGAEEKGGGEGDGDAENVAIATEYSERPEMSPLYRETGRDFLPGQGGVSGIETTDEAEKGSGVWGGTAGYKSFRVYRMTWGEWMWTAWTAPSWSDCWRSLKEGRHAEAHGNDGFSRGYAAVHEGTSLISPPEERKLYLSKAFVTFKTFTAATTARQVVHMQLAGHLAVTEAPEPTDMTWSNLYSTRTGTMMRRFVVESAVLLLIVVWVAPVTLISFIVSEDALRSYSTAIDHWCTRSELFLSAVELVQPAALVAIMNCLPPILTALGVVEGCVSFSSNQFRSFDRYFTFQVINVFLVTTIAGSVIDCVKEIYLDPSSAFALLGSSLPKMGGYFANFLIMKVRPSAPIPTPCRSHRSHRSLLSGIHRARYGNHSPPSHVRSFLKVLAHIQYYASG